MVRQWSYDMEWSGDGHMDMEWSGDSHMTWSGQVIVI